MSRMIKTISPTAPIPMYMMSPFVLAQPSTVPGQRTVQPRVDPVERLIQSVGFALSQAPGRKPLGRHRQRIASQGLLVGPLACQTMAR
jgi:hypothetical protein